jgi:hypothetical protein
LWQKYGKEGRSGLYQHGIIQMIVNKVYFKNKHDDGVILDTIYRPFPVVGMALILAAVSCRVVIL